MYNELVNAFYDEQSHMGDMFFVVTQKSNTPLFWNLLDMIMNTSSLILCSFYGVIRAKQKIILAFGQKFHENLTVGTLSKKLRTQELHFMYQTIAHTLVRVLEVCIFSDNVPNVS